MCPECRETSEVTAGGVKEITNNFFINHLLGEVDLKRKVEGEDEAKCNMYIKEGKAVALYLDCVTFLCECNNVIEFTIWSELVELQLTSCSS